MFDVIPYARMSWQITEMSNAFSNNMFSASEEILKTKCSVYLSSESLLNSKHFHNWGDAKNNCGNLKLKLVSKQKQDSSVHYLVDS